MKHPNKGVANSVDPDQTVLKEQSDMGLHCFHKPIWPDSNNYALQVGAIDLLIMMLSSRTRNLIE